MCLDTRKLCQRILSAIMFSNLTLHGKEQVCSFVCYEVSTYFLVWCCNFGVICYRQALIVQLSWQGWHHQRALWYVRSTRQVVCGVYMASSTFAKVTLIRRWFQIRGIQTDLVRIYESSSTMGTASPYELLLLPQLPHLIKW